MFYEGANHFINTHQMGEPMCEEEAEEIIGYVDKNGDGKIDIDEFIIMMLKCIQEEEELEHEDED